jgi:MoxR-like ATPase
MSEKLLEEWRSRALAYEKELNQVILGLGPAIRSLNIAIFARGHVLLEGNVGVGKTTLLRAASRGLGGGYQRIEGTIDLMPQDLVYHTYIDMEGKPRVEPGPILTHGNDLSVFFFNEINRARPQVHSLLLRTMEERSVTAFNKEFTFPHLLVFADRNAVEKEETFELPGAARDRFLMELEINPETDSDVLKSLYFDDRFHDTDKLISDITPASIPFDELTNFTPLIQQSVVAGESVKEFVLHLRHASHRPVDYGIEIDDVEMDELIVAGMGPRGASMLIRAAKVSAWLDGRLVLTPEDISAVFHQVVAHRLFFTPVYELQRARIAKAFTSAILKHVPTP